VKPKNSRNSGGASSHAPPLLAARGPRRRRTERWKIRGQSQLHLLFPSLPAVRVFITCKRIKHPSQLILIFFLSFSDLFRSSPFQISFTVDLSFVYIFFSFASGGRQLGSAAVCRGRR
jgi:hypothetical protein